MEIEADLKFIEDCKNDFSYFIEYIFPLSFKQYTEAPHLIGWAKRIQYNNKTATLSARKHLKSTLMYAYIMWRIFKMQESEDWLYMSYTESLSRYHTRNIKRLILLNPWFKHIKDMTTAESTLRYSWDKEIFTVTPASISRFNRGWHGKGVICDDILADPTNELNMTIIQTITNTFFEEVLSLPTEEGELHLVGTAQHQEDVFFQIKTKSPSFNWAMYPAILNYESQETLWSELFTFKRLIEIRDQEIGEKAFNKEYLCSPVWSEDAYFKREQIRGIIDNSLIGIKGIANEQAEVYAGYDIGKVRHPSHFSIFLFQKGIYHQVYQIFMYNWDYTKQIEFIKELIKDFKIKRIYYDATRGELESFFEGIEPILRRGLWQPVKFTSQEKFKLAANFAKLVDNKSIQLQNDEKMIRSILSVNNNLEAMETSEGHGDAFWSIAMALSHRKTSIPIPGGTMKRE